MSYEDQMDYEYERVREEAINIVLSKGLPASVAKPNNYLRIVDASVYGDDKFFDDLAISNEMIDSSELDASLALLAKIIKQ